MALFSKWDIETDFISVGSGLGGMAGAMIAHDSGKKAIILEKAPKLGGVCAYSGGEVFVPANHLMAKAGITDSREEGLKYLQFLAAGYADPELQAALLDNGIAAARYFEEKAGVRWKIVKNFPDYNYPKAPGTIKEGRYLEVELIKGSELGDWRKKSYRSPHVPNGITHDEMFAWGGTTQIMKWDFALLGQRMSEDYRGFGPGMMAYFIKAAVIDRKIPAYVDTAVRELIMESGSVVGVRAEQMGSPNSAGASLSNAPGSGKQLMIRARKGVLLAAGGYDWNAQMPKYYEQLPEWNSQVLPTIEGDALVMGGEQGAAMAGVAAYNLPVIFGYQVPGEMQEGKPMWRGSWEGGYPHALWVNQSGKRFCDESFYRDYIPKMRILDGQTQTQPNFPPYLIFDSQFKEKYPLGTFLPPQEIPETLAARGNSLTELASKLGIDGDALEATVKRFNGLCAEHVDKDFGRGTYPWAAMMTGDFTRTNPNLGPLEKPPFYGLRLHPVSVGVNSVGLKCNVHAQVMHVRGRPIPGLYAAGNAAAPLDIGSGYQSGLSNLRGLVGGFVAGKHAALR